jgi:CRISPR/Cas system-associated exonuclease Cas4 (RecB family)
MSATASLSKSKLIAYRQCPRRLWLEIHRPELRKDAADTQARLQAGADVSAIARELYDPERKGTLIDLRAEGVARACVRTQQLLSERQPIFEAGLSAAGALAFADVMLPTRHGTWRMIEVKSATKVKDYHLDEAAIQTFVTRKAGMRLESVQLACIDSSWTFAGDGDYNGLLHETDVTDDALARGRDVQAWIADAQRIACSRREPKTRTGGHCSNPFNCAFYAYCASKELQPEHPSAWLPRVRRAELRKLIANGLTEMRDVPDALLTAQQQRVKRQTLSGETYFDRDGAAAALAPHKQPAYFLDFETVQFAVPRWKGTRPYQQIPFQFSVRRLSRGGVMGHSYFLDTSGKDPSHELAKALIAAVGSAGPVFTYNAGFERQCLRELGERYPRLAVDLRAIDERVADLWPIAERFYYHPSQRGSWSLKAVLPAIAPDLRHAELDGVQDGSMAMAAYTEAIHPEMSTERKREIEEQLLDYCGLDTLALVRIWAFLAGRAEMRI